MSEDWSNPDNLPANASHYDGQNALYYRGDGVRTTVSLPEGKTVVSVSSGYWYVVRGLHTLISIYTNGERPVPNGELITITLKDAE